MNESVLQALMRLFAMVASVNEEGHARNDRDVVVEYLQHQFSNELVDKYLRLFDEYIIEYHQHDRHAISEELEKKEDQRTNAIDTLCAQLNQELERPPKVLIILYLLDFIYRGDDLTRNERDFLSIIATNLNIPENVYHDARAFTFNRIDEIREPANLLFINNGERHENKAIKHIRIDKVEGQICVHHITWTNTYVLRYYGPQTLLLNGHHVRPERTYIWALGSVLKNSRFGSIYYTWVAGRFIQATSKTNFVFEARQIEYIYGSGPNGIKPFNLNEESGRLIGIIGGSGSGKSTLLKLLSGILKPRRGSILINGMDIHSHARELEGVIGYVPQDDFLIKELTVFENLYYNARLSFSESSEEEISKIVDEALLNFDLVEARDLQVGDSLNTFLSGGQRKRLNIALELLREPSILFVDEPTSGLSSADSEKVMNLLKRQTFKGKLVFANIHQPSSEIFKLFDKLLVVDQGGRVIYYGNPLDAIGYFKRINHYVDAEESECLTCGNINSDQILRNVEVRVVDINGRLTRKRKIAPEEWYSLYMERIDPIIRSIRRPFKDLVPSSLYQIPRRWDQLKIFFKRDLLAKLRNNQYLAVTLLEAPILALILSFYTRSARDASGQLTDYVYGLNNNIPAFLFMSVIVALFLGLVLSAEEIFKDRKILERERFLNLSRSSYLFSKITILFIISAIQMLLFVLIGNSILEIQKMTWRYFLILFSTSCWANLIGLNISSGFKSVVTIYILVPLILVPQLLFSGVVVDFHSLNPSIYSAKYVPAIGETMTSRWAYETMVVTQFKDNPYEKKFFNAEQTISESMYKKAYVVPELRRILDNLPDSSAINGPGNQEEVRLLKNELGKLNYGLNITLPQGLDRLQQGQITNEQNKALDSYLKRIWKHYHQKYLDAVTEREQLIASMTSQLGGKTEMVAYRNRFVNEKLSSLALNEQEMVEYITYEDEFVRMRDPVYTLPTTGNGRAHFLAPYKRVGPFYVDTFWFNIIIIWLSSGLWFVILYYDLLRKLIEYFEGMKLQRFNRRIRKILRQFE